MLFVIVTLQSIIPWRGRATEVSERLTDTLEGYLNLILTWVWNWFIFTPMRYQYLSF